MLPFTARIFAALVIITGLTLPYASTAAGLQVSLPGMLRHYLFISQHRQLAPLLIACALLLAATLAAPGIRWLAIAAIVVSCAWGFLMIAIPMGFAHVRPAYGYWINQALLLGVIVLLASTLQKPA